MTTPGMTTAAATPTRPRPASHPPTIHNPMPDRTIRGRLGFAIWNQKAGSCAPTAAPAITIAAAETHTTIASGPSDARTRSRRAIATTHTAPATSNGKVRYGTSDQSHSPSRCW